MIDLSFSIQHWINLVGFLFINIGFAADGIHDGIMISKCTQHRDLERLWHWLKYLPINGSLIILGAMGFWTILGIFWGNFSWLYTVITIVIGVLTGGVILWPRLYTWSRNKQWPDWA